MDLDLGSKPVANVKVGGDVYEMSVPTVKQALAFNDEMNGTEDDIQKATVFVKFVCDLGMPEEVADELSVQQMTKLAEGLLGTAEKK